MKCLTSLNGECVNVDVLVLADLTYKLSNISYFFRLEEWNAVCNL